MSDESTGLELLTFHFQIFHRKTTKRKEISILIKLIRTWLIKFLACNAFGLVLGSFSASLLMISSTLQNNTKLEDIKTVSLKQISGMKTNNDIANRKI